MIKKFSIKRSYILKVINFLIFMDFKEFFGIFWKLYSLKIVKKFKVHTNEAIDVARVIVCHHVATCALSSRGTRMAHKFILT